MTCACACTRTCTCTCALACVGQVCVKQCAKTPQNPTHPTRMPSFASGLGAYLRVEPAWLQIELTRPGTPTEVPLHINDYAHSRWDCDEFLGAAARDMHELWHPVKNRSCWAAYLDACDATGCHAPAPALQPYCRETGGVMRKCTLSAHQHCVTNCTV